MKAKAPPKLALSGAQEYVRTCLENACRVALARHDQPPHSLLLGALFLWAVRGLPFGVEQFPITLTLKTDHDEAYVIKSMTIGGAHLSLHSTEGINSGMGWDERLTVDWSVDDIRQEGLDEWVLEDVLRSFARDVGDPECEVHFSTDCDHDFQHIVHAPEPVEWQAAFDNDKP